MDAAPELPATIWARALSEFLPYSDIRRCAEVNRFFLDEVAPLVTRLYVFSPKELHTGLARRYPAVRDIFLYCLLSDPPPAYQGYHYTARFNYDAAERILPFLECFSSLESAFVGGLSPDEDGRSWLEPEHIRIDRIYDPGATVTDDDGQSQWVTREDKNRPQVSFRGMVQAFCDAFQEERLQSSLILHGVVDSAHLYGRSQLRCRGDSPSCALCTSICHTFPLDAVCNFTKQTRQLVGGFKGDVWHLAGGFTGDVCLSDEDRFAIIADRQGGSDKLKSTDILVHLLCCHNNLTEDLFENDNNDNKDPPDPVIYDKSVFETMRVLRDTYGCKPEDLGREATINAICQFKEIPVEKREIGSETFEELTLLGFDMRKEDFRVFQCKGSIVLW